MKLGISLHFFSLLRLEIDPRICTCKASCPPLNYILQPGTKTSQTAPWLSTRDFSVTIAIKLVQIL